MPNVALYNIAGQSIGELELKESIFGIEPNASALHAVVKAYLANQRQGTQSALTRAEVRGGGIKIYRQKGTGRARQGSTRAPQWAGGGVVFGPHPHGHYKKVNSKEVKLALRSVLSGKVRDEELLLVDELAFDEPSTKQAKAMLEALGVADRRVTVVVADDDVATYLSFRNLEKVRVMGASEATAATLIDNGALVMSAATAKQFEEVLA